MPLTKEQKLGLEGNIAMAIKMTADAVSPQTSVNNAGKLTSGAIAIALLAIAQVLVSCADESLVSLVPSGMKGLKQ